MAHRFVLFVLALASFGCAPSPMKLTVKLPSERFTMANGLEVAMQPDHSSPYVAVRLRYHVGGKNDPSSRKGLAHLVEHLMFTGSPRVGTDEFFRLLDLAGSYDDNAGTTVDWTDYYETVPSTQLALALEIEADRMAAQLSTVDEKLFERERDIVKNELHQRYTNTAYGATWNAVPLGLFPAGHPYHSSPIGTVADLDTTTLADAVAFAKAFYVPNNATLVLAGDIDPARARDLVAHAFGDIAPQDAPPSARIEEVQHTTAKRVLIDAGVDQARVVVAWPTPAWFATDTPALSIAASAVVGIVRHRLVSKREDATNVSWSLAHHRLGGWIAINATGPRIGPDDLTGEIEYAVTRIARGDDDEDIPHARSNAIVGHLLPLINLNERTEAMADWLEGLGTLDGAQEVMHRDSEVTPSDVARAASTRLDVRNALVVWIRPHKGAPPGGVVVEVK